MAGHDPGTDYIGMALDLGNYLGWDGGLDIDDIVANEAVAFI
jgi:hypothetical protein